MTTNLIQQNKLSVRSRCNRIVWLAIVLAPIPISGLKNAGLRLPLPGCPLLHLTGIPCPAWGLTRSFQAIVQGDLSGAIGFHLFGVVIFAGFLMAGIHVSLELVRNRKLQTVYLPLVQSSKFQVLAFLVLLGYHATRLSALAKTGELHANFVHSPLHHWLF